MEKIKSVAKQVLKKEWIVILILGFLIFGLLYRDVIFFGKTLRGEPYAPGVLPSGPAYYSREPVKGVGHTSDPGASAWYNDPIFSLAVTQIKEGHIPWWNPYNGTGTPLLAAMQSGVTFPPKLVFLFLNPSPFLFDIYTIFRLFVAFFFTYLFLRLHRINRSIAFIGGFSYALSGSLLRYVNLEHLNIDTFLPLALFSVEYFYQKRKFLTWVLFTLSSALLVLGGFPEASLFALLLTNLYFIFRWFNSREVEVLRDWVLGNLCAILLTTPLLIPAILHISESWSIHLPEHKAGLLGLPISVLFSLVTPHAFIPALISRFGIDPATLIPGWVGGSILLLTPIVFFIRNNTIKVAVFFAIFSLLGILKDFGVVLINWLGYLPVFSQAIFFKYNNPAITFSLTVTSAFILNFILKEKLSKIHFLSSLVVFIIFYGSFYFKYGQEVLNFRLTKESLTITTAFFSEFLLIITITFVAIVVLVIIFLATKLNSNKQRFVIVHSLLFLIALELFISFPKYYPLRDQGYKEVPFLSKIRNEIGKEYRVIAKDSVLYPNIAAAYEINDPRLLEALYLKGYYEYIKTVDPTIYDRFVNANNNWFLKPAALRALGVKYVATATSFEDLGTVTSFENVLPHGYGVLEINGDTKKVISIHPPFERKFSINSTQGGFYLYVGMNPLVWSPDKGDGVCINFKTAMENKIICIDPKNRVEDRGWKKISLLSQQNNLPLELEVKVIGNQSISYDWVFMTNIISESVLNDLEKEFKLLKDFSTVQDNFVINIFELRSYKKIAYFPQEIKFVPKQDWTQVVRVNLDSIDNKVIALGNNKNLKQESDSVITLDYEINGDMKILLNNDHPRYLYVSTPFHNNLEIKDGGNKRLSWYKANLGFVLIDVEGVNEVRIKNAPAKGIQILILLSFLTSFIILFTQFKLISRPKMEK